MATLDRQIRVSERVKRELDGRRREGESYDDVLERVLPDRSDADFYDGFGMLSDEDADGMRSERVIEFEEYRR